MKLFIILVLLPILLSAQTKPDSAKKSDSANKKFLINNLQIPNDTNKLPLLHLKTLASVNFSNYSTNPSKNLFLVESKLKYEFSEDELNSGLSNSELNAYATHKLIFRQILKDKYENTVDVNWEKIERILGISKTVAAFILGALRHSFQR